MRGKNLETLSTPYIHELLAAPQSEFKNIGIQQVISGLPDTCYAALGYLAQCTEDDASLLAFEKTSQLVTTGIYRYIRHPLYSSLLLLTWGIFFKAPGLLGILLTLVSTTFLFATAVADEGECIRYFGDEYRDYKRRSKRFIPFLF